MAAKSQSGIAGLLQTVVSTPADSGDPSRSAADQAQSLESTDKTDSTAAISRKSKTRLGRPSGSPQRQRVEKGKATIRIREDVLEEYREWTWDARCQLGELIERALIEYRDRHRKNSASLKV